MALKNYIATLEGVKKASEGKQDKLNTTQEAAINSGITADKISTYSDHVNNNDIHVTTKDKQTWTNKQDVLNSAQIAATNSGIDSTKVGNYSDHIVNNNIHVSDTEKLAWTAKQDALTTEQLNAVNSGIESGKVAKYDGYETTIASKQDALTTEQQSAVNSGADTTKINQIETNKTDIATLTSQVSGLTSVVSIKVEATLPATPTKNTLYFIGTAAPYHKYLVTSDGTVEDLGEGEVDLSQYYKKTETDTLLNGKLSLTGGTMTGTIIIDSSIKNASIRSNVNDGCISLFGGTSNTTGANLWLGGQSWAGSGNFGGFALNAQDLSKRRELIGKTDGTLTWDNNAVITAAGGTISGALTLGAETTLTNGSITCKEKNFILKHSNAVDYTGIYGGSYVNNGASIIVAGASNSSTPGQILLKVCTSASDLKTLVLKPDGTFTWNNNNVITSAGGTMTGTLLTTANIGLRRPDDSAMMWIGTGTDANLSGNPNIRIFGKSNTNAGCIYLDANKGGSNQTVMILKPDGTLTWGSKDIYHGGNLIANPTETGTTDLTKLQIGSTVYNLATSENLKTINGISLKGTGDIEVVTGGTIVTMPVGAIYETETEGTPGMTGTWEALDDRNEWDEVEQNITPGGGTGLIKAHLCRDGLVRIYLVDAASGDGKVINPMPDDFVPELDTVVAAAYTESSPAQLFFSKSVNIVYTTVGVKIRGEMFYKSGKTPDRVIHRWKRTA